MLALVDSIKPKEPNKCFKITYISGEIELVVATSLGVTEDLKVFITFYNETIQNEELVCMINQNLIRKIETIIEPH